MRYKVRGLDTVEPKVSFACTQCQGRLKAPLTDAGSEHACPQCNVRLVVPGEKELKNWLDERLAMQDASAPDTAVSNAAVPNATEGASPKNVTEPTSTPPPAMAQANHAAHATGRADAFLQSVFRAVRMLSLIFITLDLVVILIAAYHLLAMGQNWIRDDAIERMALTLRIEIGLALLIPLIIVPLLVHIEQHLCAIRRSLESKDDA